MEGRKMKKILAVFLTAFMMIVTTAHAQSEGYNMAVGYAVPIIAGIADNYETLEEDLTGFAFCAYDDLSIVYHWKDENCPFEKAFLFERFQIPEEGIIYAFELKGERFVALTDSNGTVLSVQNITENQKRSKLLASFASTLDLNQLSKEELALYKEFTHDLLYQSLSLGYIWFDAIMYSDGDQSSNIKNVWH